MISSLKLETHQFDGFCKSSVNFNCQLLLFWEKNVLLFISSLNKWTKLIKFCSEIYKIIFMYPLILHFIKCRHLIYLVTEFSILTSSLFSKKTGKSRQGFKFRRRYQENLPLFVWESILLHSATPVSMEHFIFAMLVVKGSEKWSCTNKLPKKNLKELQDFLFKIS